MLSSPTSLLSPGSPRRRPYLRELNPWEVQAIAAEWRRRIPYSPQAPTPRQARFLGLQNREALYGGAAGGGKSSALLMGALRYVDVPGYSALIIRKTYQDLSKPGAIMDRARQWLQGTNARWNDTTKTFTFTTTGAPATLAFGYLEHESDKYQFQSAEFQYCVARGTPILMADWSWRPIEDLRVGDEVATLLGPRPIVRTYSFGRKPVVRVEGPHGSATFSATHRLMLEDGTWASPRELQSSGCGGCGSTHEESAPPCQESSTPGGCSSWDRPPGHEPGPRSCSGSDRPGSDASSAGDRSGFGASEGALPAAEPPREWFARVALFGPGLPSEAPGTPPLYPAHGASSAPSAPSSPGSPDGCRGERHCGGGRAHAARADAPGCTPSRGGAAPPSQRDRRAGDPASTPSRSPPERWRWSHPYTSTTLAAREDVHPASARMVPAGEEEVFDLQVAEASHYVTWGRFISSNCAFDELTQFAESQFAYMNSRLRKTTEMVGIPLRMRAGSNPGGDGHEWVMARFIIGARNEFGDVWEEGCKLSLMDFDQWIRDEPTGEYDEDEKGQPYEIMADRVFVPSLLEDNPHVDKSYRAQLAALDPVTRAQLRRGDWSIKPTGNMFRPEWFKIVDSIPNGWRAKRHRYWDMAATEKVPGKNPDWTTGPLVALVNGDWYVQDVARKRGRPKAVEEFIVDTAHADGPRVPITMEQEPGSAGVNTIDHYSRLLVGYTFRGERKGNRKGGDTGGDRMTKVELAKPMSAAAENGRIHLLRASWNKAFLDEAMGFPMGAHDDIIDATAGGMRQLAGAAIQGYRSIKMGEPLARRRM